MSSERSAEKKRYFIPIKGEIHNDTNRRENNDLPKILTSLPSETANILPAMTKVKMLTWVGYLELSKWMQLIARKSEAEMDLWRRKQSQSDTMWERWDLPLQALRMERIHESRNVGSLWEAEIKQDNRILELPQGNTAQPTLDFNPLRIISDLWLPRWLRQ